MAGMAAGDRASAYSAYPPGFWRRVIVDPGANGRVLVAAMEDDARRLSLSIAHDGCRVTAVAARTERVPYSTCPGAADAIVSALTGLSLVELARVNPREQCTHLFDLAVAAIAHIGAEQRVCFDMQVADRIDDRSTAAIYRNGEPMFVWQLHGTQITGPADWMGRDLRKLSQWHADLPRPLALAATLLRRAIYVSGVRRQPDRPDMRAADFRISLQTACFTHQMPRALEAVRQFGWRRDFSVGERVPLAGFDFAAMRAAATPAAERTLLRTRLLPDGPFQTRPAVGR